jgi:hypothetical protein
MVAKRKFSDETETSLLDEGEKKVGNEMSQHEIEDELRESLDELESLKSKIIPITDRRA